MGTTILSLKTATLIKYISLIAILSLSFFFNLVSPFYVFFFTKNRWYRFDDARVSIFDPNDIPSECFGKSDAEVSKTAYMLFYDRVNKIQSPQSFSMNSDKPEILSKFLTEVQQENVRLIRDTLVCIFFVKYFASNAIK